jgi:phosphomannomutase
MLTGDETGWLLGDYILSQLDPGEVTEHTVVASSVVSSRMLARIAAAHGARHVETLTGFKWLSRADADIPGCTLVYAYEEAIGYCVDPSAVRDKDGISTAVLFCDLVVALREHGRTVLDALDDLVRLHGVHTTTALSRPVASADDAAAVMTRLRSKAPSRLCGFDVTMTDLAAVQPYERRTDAVILTGGDSDTAVRIAVRPSGTEPKVKSYIEVRRSCVEGDVAKARADARRIAEELTELAGKF